MSVPKYADIGGPAQTNGNRHYKVFVGPDSAGNPGIWHVYYDGGTEFLASPVNAAPVFTPQVPTPAAPIAAAAPAPAPAPVPTATSSSPQPTTPTAVAHPVSFNGGVQAPTADWVTNTIQGSAHYGKQYQVEGGFDNNGNPGTYHVYKDGTKEFIATATGGSGTPLSTTAGTGPAMQTSPVSSQLPDWNHPTASSNSNPTGGTEAPASFAVSNRVDDTGGTSVSAASGSAYTVKAGDTLSGIAADHNMSLGQLESTNTQIQDHNLIRPGEQVNLGDASGGAAFPTNSTYPNTSSPAAGGVVTDQIKSGWSDGSGNVPSDPAGQVMAAAEHPKTDPLRINDSKNHSA